MGKIKTFEILVDGPEHGQTGQYKPGDTLHGHVLLKLTQDMDVNEVTIRFNGRAHIQWEENRRFSPMAEMNGSYPEPVYAEEVYVDEKHKLFPTSSQVSGSRQSQTGTGAVLTSGLHAYSFRFRIPPSTPGSFSGSQGGVRYVLKAVIDRPWKLKANSRVIHVESALDLNHVPAARDQVRVSSNFTLGSKLFPTGACRVSILLDRRGFVAGEAIPVQYSVQNNSEQHLHRITLHLNMFVTYTANDKRCVHQFLLSKSSLGKVPAGKTLEGVVRTLRIPSTCKPNPGCKFINIRYQLQMKIKPSLLSVKRLRLSTDLVVGTQPIERRPAVDDLPPDYWSCCPPPYEEAIAAYTAMSTSSSPPSSVSIRRINVPSLSRSLSMDFPTVNDSSSSEESSITQGSRTSHRPSISPGAYPSDPSLPTKEACQTLASAQKARPSEQEESDGAFRDVLQTSRISMSPDQISTLDSGDVPSVTKACWCSQSGFWRQDVPFPYPVAIRDKLHSSLFYRRLSESPCTLDVCCAKKLKMSAADVLES